MTISEMYSPVLHALCVWCEARVGCAVDSEKSEIFSCTQALGFP